MSENMNANQLQPSSPQHDPWELQEIAALGISDDQWERMQQVEHLFRKAPMVDAPPDFAAKVMLTIASKQFDEMNKPPSGGSSGGPSEQKKGGWKWPGRKMLFLMSITGALTLGVLLTVLVGQGGIANGLLRQAVEWLNGSSQQMAGLWGALTQFAPSDVLMPLLMISAMAMVGAWGWAMYRLAQRRQQVVYHIPIRFD